MYSKLAKAHTYARRNGYEGSYDEYITLQYKGYREICKRCDTKPMSRDEWFDSLPA